MLQVETTNITPHSVLLASGHVDRFTDLLVEELDSAGNPTGEYHRADKILEAHLEKLLRASQSDEEKDELQKMMNQADALSEEEMDAAIIKYGVAGPTTKNKLSKCKPFNLMFATTIGPSGLAKAYLRPETAQGIFVNFKRLLEYNNGKMPFASAQVGTGFRNEIAPKGGLIRVREFTMAEIEHFVHPRRKQHPRFNEVKDVVLQLFTADAQMTTFEMENIPVGQAVAQGKINNETLAYFMARSQQFFIKIGIDPKRLRFRQHLRTEMAHYASDCYDAEILLAQGWLECAGHADRACYDLEQHSKATKIELTASERLDEPRVERFTKLEPVKKVIGASFKQRAGAVIAFLESLPEAEAVKMDEELTAKGKIAVTLSDGACELTRDACKLVRGEIKVNEEKYIPSVIEPSFGIGRILYSVLEHSYYVREGEALADEQQKKEGPRDLTVLVRNVLRLRPNIAPVKCGVIPHGSSFDVEHAKTVCQSMNEAALNSMTDLSSAAIGRKYARFDEIGVPFCVTLDDRTKEDNTGTVRERDSEEQVRVPVDECVDVVRRLCTLVSSWEDIKAAYPVELRPGQKQ
jgi:glycyl-tRNA synthetase